MQPAVTRTAVTSQMPTGRPNSVPSRVSSAGIRTFDAVLWDDRASVAPHLSRVLAILEDAGYTVWTDWEPQTRAEGTPGTYVCHALDVDPRTGVRNYDLRVFEDATRPVIARITGVLRDP